MLEVNGSVVFLCFWCPDWARKQHLGQVFPTPSHSLLNPGNIFFQPFSASFFDFFYSLSLWSIRSLSSPLCFFSYFLTKRECVSMCVCLQTAMYIDCWSHTFPQSVWVILFIPLSTPMSVKIVAIFWLSNNTIKIQKLVFPPLRAGSHWDGFGTARYANEASFMGAANDGSPKKSVQIIGVDARKRSTLFLSFHRKGIVRAAKTWLRYV